MNDVELRTAVTKARKRPVPDNTWEYMDQQGFVETAVEEEGEAAGDPVGYFLRELDRLSEAAPLRSSAKRTGRTQEGERVPPQLTEYEIQRSELFSEYLVRQASPDEEVRGPIDKPIRTYAGAKRFRVKYLDDTLLSSEQALALLASPAAALLWAESFASRRVSILDHAYRVEEGLSDESGPFSLVEVFTADSKTIPLKDRRPLQAGLWDLPDKRESAKSNEEPRREGKTPTGLWKILTYPGEDGYTRRVLVKPLSILGKLHAEVSRLIKRCPWDEAEATWFMLTGDTPWVAPLTWQFRGTGGGSHSWNYGFITLKVEPWVSARVVNAVYSDLQRKLLGKDNKQVGEKNRELFRFVVGRMKPDGSLPKARMLVEQWDRENPQWHYGHQDTDQVRRFRRDYNIARRLLAAPEYELRSDD